LKSAGAERAFAEKVSGAKTDRKALANALASLASGDVLLVTRLDRLARSTRDLLNVLDAVAKAGAGFKSIADPMIDTTSAHGKLILAVLAALAEFERSMILARTSEGRKRAQARGVRSVGRLSSHHSKWPRLLLGASVVKPWPRSAAATTSVTQRYRGSDEEGLVETAETRPAPSLG